MRFSSRARISAMAVAAALTLGGLGIAQAQLDNVVDLSIKQTPSDHNLQVGQFVTISVTVKNSGGPSTIVTSDQLPAGLTFVGLTINDPRFERATTCVTPAVGTSGTITCTTTSSLGPLPAGTFEDVATVTLAAATPGVWPNTVSISAPGFVEQSPGNNRSFAQFKVGPRFLSR